MAPVGTVFNGLREQVFEANREIVRAGLVILTFGNASAADRAAGVMGIKPRLPPPFPRPRTGSRRGA